MRSLLAASLTLLALVFSGAVHARIAGPTTVTDGDSITVSGQRIRLFGIDAPEGTGGRPGDFVTSGLSADEHRALGRWPDGPALFAHPGALASPLRLADLAEFVNARLPSPCPWRSQVSSSGHGRRSPARARAMR